MVGSTLSHYHIVDELGRGGMGIVYLAEDTKLDRQIAIKVLPSSALASEDDRARFYREAKAAAALNHPNIAQIYQIDEAVPSDAPHGTQPSPFIAMEYIDGETLDARIKEGPLKLKEAVRLAAQIAGALGEAHEKGIVHRDVKASNVMLTSKGDAKVLDFGLALTAASTKLTRMGSTLGTVAYMSPEQARGEEVDSRTDLWALGVVLYEMIAGRNPFGGDYEQAVVYSILNADPEPLTAVRTGVPMQLEWTVGKLLSKDADLRYQSAAGLLADLKALDLSGSGQSWRSMSAMSAAPVAGADASSTWAGRPVWLVALLGAAVLIAGAAIGAMLLGRSEHSMTELAALQSDLLIDRGHEDFPKLSEDGRYLAFTGDKPTLAWYLKDLVSGEERQLPNSGSLTPHGAFSSDGRWFVWRHEDTIWKALTAGGAAVELGLDCRRPVFVDSERFVCHDAGDESGIPRATIMADLDGNVLRTVLKPDSAAGIADVNVTDILPGGRWAIGFINPLGGEFGDDDLGVFDLKTGEIVRLNQKGTMPRYIASGHVFFLGDINAAGFGPPIARPFDADSRRFTGPVFPVPGEVLSPAQHDVNDSGLLVWGTHRPGDRYQFEWWSLAGDLLETIQVEPDDYEFSALSPDGTRLAVKLEDDPNSKQDIWIIEIESGSRYQLSYTEDADYPLWSGDGEKVYMVTDFEGINNALAVKPANFAGNLSIALEGVSEIYFPHVAPNDRVVAFERRRERAIEVRALTNPDSVRTINRDGSLGDPALSNDGAYVAYSDWNQNRRDIFVQESWGDRVWPVTTVEQGFARNPHWSLDGRWLYYIADSGLWRARVHFNPTFQSERPQRLFELPDGIRDFHVHPDGERVLLRKSLPPEGAEVAGRTRLSLRINLGQLLNEIAPPSE